MKVKEIAKALRELEYIKAELSKLQDFSELIKSIKVESASGIAHEKDICVKGIIEKITCEIIPEYRKKLNTLRDELEV